jgi:indolepyruvate ferredoxin oxidoreductase
MTLMQIGLDDKYQLDTKRIYLSGIQALVRLPTLQRVRDRAQNLNTAGFISGYRGSPLGMYDNALWRAKSFLQSHDIAFAPGLNEDLAATAVWGSQQVGLFPGAKVDGVFGIWYGKGPGVDRSLDALKHANSAGTARHGGVLALAGDDHGCQSSTLAHQSEQVFAAALMPVLNPATLQDYLDLGLYGFALSRFSGCWVGFKAISETVESSASIYSDPARVQVVLPSDFAMPPGGLNIRWPDPPLEQERRLHGPKMDAIAAFARANQLDRIVLDSKPARLGIVATGKAYLDLRQALADLGITERDAQQLGLRIYKVADLAARREWRATFCRGFAGRPGGRGKARLCRRSTGAHSLQYGCFETSFRGRQTGRRRRDTVAERRRAHADHGRCGAGLAPAAAWSPKSGP